MTKRAVARGSADLPFNLGSTTNKLHDLSQSPSQTHFLKNLSNKVKLDHPERTCLQEARRVGTSASSLDAIINQSMGHGRQLTSGKSEPGTKNERRRGYLGRNYDRISLAMAGEPTTRSRTLQRAVCPALAAPAHPSP